MKTIWKFPIGMREQQTVEIPIGANILSAQIQAETLCLWALANPACPKAERRIYVIGTGHEFDSDGKRHIATVQQGAYVWHVFEDV